MSNGYDDKCADLAEYFLHDEEHTDEDVARLAQDIQDGIERWFESRISIPKNVMP